MNGPDEYRRFEDLSGLPRGPGRSMLWEERENERSAAAQPRSLLKRLRDYSAFYIHQWLKTYLDYLGKPIPDLPTYSPGETGVYGLTPTPVDGESEVRVSLFADWGTGTLEAKKVSDHISDRFHPHFAIHLGDVYYVGSRKAVRENCLQGFWPVASRGSFALNGNHEMYARGEGYFRELLPAIGMNPGQPDHGEQKTSFFALENDHWRIIALDTGYHSAGRFFPTSKKKHRLPKQQLDWLQTLGTAGKRGIVLLSHHQYYSDFEHDYKKPAEQLKRFIDRPVLWFWGHEHRLALYGRDGDKKGISAFGRCIGHGGMPVEKIDETPEGRRKIVFYDRREARQIAHGTWGGGKRFVPVGYNGFANLTFSGRTVRIDYRDQENRRLLTETWGLDARGHLQPGTVQKNPDQDPRLDTRDIVVVGRIHDIQL